MEGVFADVSQWGLSDAIVVALITFLSSALAAWVGRRSTRERDADVLAKLEPTAVSMWERQEGHIARLEEENRQLRNRIHDLELQVDDS